MIEEELLEDERTRGTPWRIVTASDPRARALADRHYNRKTIGAPTVGPPGRRLVLVSTCARALWITHYPRPDLALDGIDALRCSSFRNERSLEAPNGAGLSSELIVAAMTVTARAWPDTRPPGGWLTFVDRAKTSRKRDPGRCFLRAGWWIDDDFAAGRWARSLVRLRARMLEEAIS